MANGVAAKCTKMQSEILREQYILEIYEIRMNTIIQICILS